MLLMGSFKDFKVNTQEEKDNRSYKQGEQTIMDRKRK
jgi:hypothetical protein